MENSREALEVEKNSKCQTWKREKYKKDKMVELTKAALFTAAFCVLAPLTLYLPFSPVGITLGSFLLYLTGLLLGPRLGCISVFLYLCMGCIGLPVFAGYTAGAGVLFGPTGGFLIGYLPCVWVTGRIVKGSFGGKKGMVCFGVGMAVGTTILYLFGTLWFMFVYAGGTSFGAAVMMCVFPFLPFDLIKIILAMVLYYPFLRLKLCV